MTRDEAIEIAKFSAAQCCFMYSYLPQSKAESDEWAPHEWIINAILKTAEDYETNVRM